MNWDLSKQNNKISARVDNQNKVIQIIIRQNYHISTRIILINKKKDRTTYDALISMKYNFKN